MGVEVKFRMLIGMSDIVGEQVQIRLDVRCVMIGSLK